jgi:hypothetical protein
MVVRRGPIMAPPGRHLSGIRPCAQHPSFIQNRASGGFLRHFKITADEWKARNDLVMPSHASAERGGGKIVYPSALRKRMDHGDEPSDPRLGLRQRDPMSSPSCSRLQRPKLVRHEEPPVPVRAANMKMLRRLVIFQVDAAGLIPP